MEKESKGGVSQMNGWFGLGPGSAKEKSSARQWAAQNTTPDI